MIWKWSENVYLLFIKWLSTSSHEHWRHTDTPSESSTGTPEQPKDNLRQWSVHVRSACEARVCESDANRASQVCVKCMSSICQVQIPTRKPKLMKHRIEAQRRGQFTVSSPLIRARLRMAYCSPGKCLEESANSRQPSWDIRATKGRNARSHTQVDARNANIIIRTISGLHQH